MDGRNIAAHHGAAIGRPGPHEASRTARGVTLIVPSLFFLHLLDGPLTAGFARLDNSATVGRLSWANDARNTALFAVPRSIISRRVRTVDCL